MKICFQFVVALLKPWTQMRQSVLGQLSDTDLEKYFVNSNKSFLANSNEIFLASRWNISAATQIIGIFLICESLRFCGLGSSWTKSA